MGGLRSLPGERPCRWRAARGVPPSGESGGKARGLMRCSKMAMRRKSEMRTAVAAKPKEMALALVGASAAPLMDKAAAASSLATLSPAGSDAAPAPAPATPTHGLDLCPAKLLMAPLTGMRRGAPGRGNASIRDG